MSGGLLAGIAGLALLDAVNPATILGVALILLLPGERRTAKAITFVLGAYISVLAAGAALFLAADTAAEAVAGGLVWVRRVAFTLAAVSLLLAAARRLRPHRRLPVTLPSWLTVTTAAPLGLMVTAADLPNAFPYVLAVERLVSAGVDATAALLVLAGYALVYCLPCLLLLAAATLWGGSIRPRLERLHARFGGERDVPRSVPAAIGLSALAAGAAGIAVAA